MNVVFPIKNLIKTALTSSSISVLVAGAIVSSQAAITYSANFDGMTSADEENNNTGYESNVSTINQVNPKAGANDLVWQSLGLSSSFPHRSSLSIVDDALHISGITTVNGKQETTKYKGVMANLPTAATLVNIGDSISITLTGQFDSSPDSGQLRMGFIVNSSAGKDSIYQHIGTGGSTTSLTHWDANGSIGNYGAPEGTFSPPITGTNQSLRTAPFTISFSVELTNINEATNARTYGVTTIVDDDSSDEENGFSKLVVSINDSANRGFSDFDSFFIRTQDIDSGFTLDDVVITYIPEPSVPLMLGSLLCSTLFFRRRV